MFVKKIKIEYTDCVKLYKKDRCAFMIQREDILSMEYLKKTSYTGSHMGMRYRLEKAVNESEETGLRCCVWPEPFNFFKTPEEQKSYQWFTFDEDGVVDAIAWMNDKLFEEKDRFDRAKENWDTYKM